jgi:hypothetical protein
MRAERDPNATCAINNSKSARRKRRLRRGVLRWDQDRLLCGERTRRIARITLTLRNGDFEAAYGQVRDFWAKVRRTWLGTRYFCWLELTRKGNVHYHAVWLNPPHFKRVNLLAWVDKAWGQGRTQVRFAAAEDGLRNEIDYALGYAKKLGRKSYQQRYEAVPRELRTFMSQRLEIPPDVLDEHTDRDFYRYCKPEVVDGVLVAEHLHYLATLEHAVPRPGRCSALDWRRPRPGNNRGRRAPPRASPSGLVRLGTSTDPTSPGAG